MSGPDSPALPELRSGKHSTEADNLKDDPRAVCSLRMGS